MLNQTISLHDVKTLAYKIWKKHKSTLDYSEFAQNEHTIISNKLSDEKYDFATFKQIYVNGKDGLDFNSSTDEIIIKKLNDNIRRLFKVKPSDRHAIIKQTISLSADSQPIKIARLDIVEFYEKIPRDSIVKYVTNEFLLSHQNRKFLNSWNDQLTNMGITGLPRGMSLSSTLSEIYVRKFDQSIRNECDVYYYARYVDDIIIFYTGSEEELLRSLQKNLNQHAPNLAFNESKTNFFDLKPKNHDNQDKYELDYLGYKVLISKNNKKSIENQREVIVVISDKKINKIKSRIRKSFASYNRNRNFELLYSRLKFLSGNQYVIGDIERTKLKSGIYYNYPLITDKSQLKHLDNFYRRFINSKNPITTKAMTMIKNHNSNNCRSRIDKIKSISFEFGYDFKIMNRFDRKTSKNIKRCW